MAEKLFKVVGVSTKEGVIKFRFANGDKASRQKVLERDGHAAINLIELDEAMGKSEARDFYISKHPEAASIQIPVEKAEKPQTKTVKTVVVSKTKGKKITDAANELLKEVEGSAS